MRRRFGAIHSESTEEYIETAIKAQDNQLLYYDQLIKSKKKMDLKNFNFSELETNVSSCDEPTCTGYNKKFMLIDTGDHIGQVLSFCGIQYFHNSYNFQFCSISHQENQYQFWISPANTKYPEIVNVYVNCCSDHIYFYENDDEQFQNYVERIKSIHKSFTIFKVIISNFPKSQVNNNFQFFKQSLQSLQQFDNIITIQTKTVSEALWKIIRY